MNEIIQKLEELETIFKAANAPVLQQFNPGLPEEKIITFFTENNIPIHPDLISLYQWHNGLKSIYGQPSDMVDLSPMGSFPNLDEMLALRNDFLSFDLIDVENQHEFVPISSCGEDYMRLLNVSSGQIYNLGSIYFIPDFRSLTSMLDFLLNCYKTNILKMHPTEGLQIDETYWELEHDYPQD